MGREKVVPGLKLTTRQRATRGEMASNNTSVSRRISVLLEKCANYDKDERYMATADLLSELQENVSIDFSLERRICAAILKQLDDSSNDVQVGHEFVAIRALQSFDLLVLLRLLR